MRRLEASHDLLRDPQRILKTKPGTLRGKSIRQRLPLDQFEDQRLKAIITAQAESFGCEAKIDWRQGYAVLVNTPQETAFAREVALELVGADRVTLQGPPLTGSEDFAFMLEKVPGSYLLIGNGDGDSAGACMVHNPGYDFNDDNVALGAAYWVLLAERFLK